MLRWTAWMLLAICLMLAWPMTLAAQTDGRPTARITGADSYPLTKGLLTAWLAVSDYTVVDRPARYECRLNGFIDQRSGGGGGIQTPWVTIGNQSTRIATRVLFTLYDDGRRVIFDSALIPAGRAQSSFSVSGNSGNYSSNAWGYGDTTADAIVDFFRHLPPAPAAAPVMIPSSPAGAESGPTVNFWVDLIHQRRRTVISGPPGTQFWTRFFAIKPNGQRGDLTSTALRTIDERGWYVLWTSAAKPRIVEIIIDGETNPRQTIILFPGGQPGPNESF